MIRKITPVIFLIIFFLPVCSVYFLFNVRRTEIHNAVQKVIQAGVSESRLVLLKIPLSVEKYGDFQRTEEMEFRYNGQMFDVSKVEKHGDTTWYWGLWDKEETELEEQMKVAAVKATGSDLSTESSKETSYIFLEELFIEITYREFHVPISDKVAWADYLKVAHLSRSIVPPTPPPEV